eukprot:scaffold3342_cov174-Amphora_coffeaeformis.AAC.6
MTTRRKRPLHASTAGIAPPISTLHVLRRSGSDANSSSSFTRLVFQVGIVVAIVGSVMYTFLSSTNLLWQANEYHHYSNNNKQRMRKGTPPEKKLRVHYRPQTVDPPKSLPSHMDVFKSSSSSLTANPALTQAAKDLRRGFMDNYGTTTPTSETAKEIYQRGVWSPNLAVGTNRLTEYLKTKKMINSSDSSVFHMVVLGNSAPAGYGNHRHEAYASRLQDLLAPAFQSIGIRLQVSNWAMNDLTEFPFTWCLSNFYLKGQPPPDMIIWDFNGENYPSSRFEAFLRQVSHVPFLVVRNGFRQDSYFALLKYYHKQGLWQDVTVLSDGHAVEQFWKDWKRELPTGLSKWDHFGAPGGTADKLHPHLSVQEHWLIASLLSMRMLPSLEQATATINNNEAEMGLRKQPAEIPLPLLLDTGDPWLLGEKSEISCYSGFEHVPRKSDLSEVMQDLTAATTTVHSNLPLLVNATNMDDPSFLLKPKSVQFYHQGWVYDLEAAPKRSKQRTKQTDFLGFTDWKTAFYGEYQSGALTITLPTKPGSTLKRLVLCQADDPMDIGSCALPNDLLVRIDGKEVTKSLVDRRIVKTIDDKPLCTALDLALDFEPQATGVAIDVEVSNHRVRWNQGPCSIAHVLAEWQ